MILTAFFIILKLDLHVYHIKAVHNSSGIQKENYTLITMHFFRLTCFNLLSIPITLDNLLVTICIWHFHVKFSSNNILIDLKYLHVL